MLKWGPGAAERWCVPGLDFAHRLIDAHQRCIREHSSARAGRGFIIHACLPLVAQCLFGETKMPENCRRQTPMRNLFYVVHYHYFVLMFALDNLLESNLSMPVTCYRNHILV